MPSVRISKIGRPYKAPDLVEATRKALREEAQQVKRDYEATVKTWDKKPVFKINYNVSPYAVEVSTGSDVYKFLDKGTRKNYPITPKKPGGVLAFNTAGFQPKSKPNSLKAMSGSPAKPPTRFSKGVIHPGIRARRYSKRINQKVTRRFPNRLKRHIKRATGAR